MSSSVWVAQENPERLVGEASVRFAVEMSPIRFCNCVPQGRARIAVKKLA